MQLAVFRGISFLCIIKFCALLSDSKWVHDHDRGLRESVGCIKWLGVEKPFFFLVFRSTARFIGSASGDWNKVCRWTNKHWPCQGLHVCIKDYRIHPCTLLEKQANHFRKWERLMTGQHNLVSTSGLQNPLFLFMRVTSIYVERRWIG